MNAFIDAKNRWLEACWSPNQSPDEREDNGRIIAEAEAEMKRLNIAQ